MEHLIYLYGFIPSQETQEDPLPHLNGLDNKHDLYTITSGEISAVVCDLGIDEYNEEAINRKTEDTEWLHEKAFHHHETIIKLYKLYTIIPMRFCTIYSSEKSLKNTLAQNYNVLKDSLSWLADKEEWNLKIYCDNKKFRESTAFKNTDIQDKQNEIDQLSPGRKYLAERKLNQFIEQELEKSKDSQSANIHEVLSKMSVKADSKKVWSQNVTGKNQEMCWNSVYLIHANDAESFLNKIHSFNDEWKESGLNLQIVGPWPSYHFSNQLQSEDRHGAQQ